VSVFGGPMREEKTIATMGIACWRPLHLPPLSVTVKLPQLKTPAVITFSASLREEIVELSHSEAKSLQMFHNMLLFGTVEAPPESSRRGHLFLHDVTSSPFFLVPLFDDCTATKGRNEHDDSIAEKRESFAFDELLIREMVQSPVCVLDVMKEIIGVTKDVDFDWENDAIDAIRTHIESMIIGSPIHIATKNMQPGPIQFVVERIDWKSPLHSIHTKEGKLSDVYARKYGVSSMDMLQPLLSLKRELDHQETTSSCPSYTSVCAYGVSHSTTAYTTTSSIHIHVSYVHKPPCPLVKWSPCVTCHLLCVMCHMSPARCRMLRLSFCFSLLFLLL
jgi:hypothetical protein